MQSQVFVLEKAAVDSIGEILGRDATYRIKLLLIKSLLRRLEVNFEELIADNIPSLIEELLPF
jgi:hypothetical protein